MSSEILNSNTLVTDSLKDDQEYISVNRISRDLIETLHDRVKVVDKDEESGLELFCYNTCDETDDINIKRSRII